MHVNSSCHNEPNKVNCVGFRLAKWRGQRNDVEAKDAPQASGASETLNKSVKEDKSGEQWRAKERFTHTLNAPREIRAKCLNFLYLIWWTSARLICVQNAAQPQLVGVGLPRMRATQQPNKFCPEKWGCSGSLWRNNALLRLANSNFYCGHCCCCSLQYWQTIVSQLRFIQTSRATLMSCHRGIHVTSRMQVWQIWLTLFSYENISLAFTSRI